MNRCVAEGSHLSVYRPFLSVATQLRPSLTTTPDNGVPVSSVTLPEAVAEQVWPEIPAAASRAAAGVP